MLLIGLSFILMLVFFFIFKYAYEEGFYFKNKKLDNFVDSYIVTPLWVGSLITSFISMIIFLFSLLTLILTLMINLQEHHTNDKIMDYQKLSYMSETIVWDDSLTLAEKEILDDIVEWNKEIVVNKEQRASIWWKDFTPKYYDNLQCIEIPEEYYE